MVKSEENKGADPEAGPSGAAPRNKSCGGGKRSRKDGQQGRRNHLLVRDMIVPSLDNEVYGDDLYWKDRSKGVFFIRWTHQGSKHFNREGRNVFQDWSVMKGNWDKQDPHPLSKAKHRVRAALHKLENLTLLEERTDHRIYMINDIQAYPVRDKEDQSKENKKKRGVCDCLTGCPKCESHEEPVKSRSKVDNDKAEVKDDQLDDHNEAYAGSEGTQKSRSAPPAASSSSDTRCTMRCPTEASSEACAQQRASSEAEEPDRAIVLSMTRTRADMEVAYILLSLTYGRHWLLQTLQSLADPLAPSPPGTVPPPETRHVDQVVPMEADTSSGEPSSNEDEGPESVHVKKEKVATAMATASLSVEPDTCKGDSPLMFWALAAPAHKE